MSPSERRPEGSDVLVREVARQLADSAPLAPTWDDLGRASLQRHQPSHGARYPRFALVAAVAALVVAGAWLLARPGAETEIPAETIPLPTAPAEAASWVDWAEVSDPLEVQLCVTRVLGNLSADSGSLLAASRSQEMSDEPIEMGIVSLHGHSAVLLGAIAAHPTAPASLVESARPVVQAFEAAQSGGSSENADLPGFAPELVEAFLVERSESAVFREDPATCWLEGITGSTVIRTFRREEGDLAVARCLSAAQLDHAAWTQLVDDSSAFRPLALESARSLGRWFDPVPADLVELTRSVEDLDFLSPAERPAAVGDIRDRLAGADLGLTTACPFGRLASPDTAESPIDPEEES